MVEAARNGFCKGSTYQTEITKYMVLLSGALYDEALV